MNSFRHFLLITVDYADLRVVWKKFQGMFGVVGDFIKYMPVFKDYHWKLLEEMHNDNVMYVEIRTSLSPVSFLYKKNILKKL